MKKLFHNKTDGSFNVLIVGCTHGDELVGSWVLERLQKIRPLRGSITGIIANSKAMRDNVRYLETDLNRSFPGNASGTYEERLAKKLLPAVQSADLVIDIHSTRSDLRSSLIATKLNRQVRHLASVARVPRLLVMEITKHNALISHARLGIAFEYGNDTATVTRTETLRGIMRILESYGMIQGNQRDTPPTRSPLIFRVRKSVAKPKGFTLSRNIKNFKQIKKNQVFASNGKDSLRASQTFYPILFGNTTYPDIFGFMGEKTR